MSTTKKKKLTTLQKFRKALEEEAKDKPEAEREKFINENIRRFKFAKEDDKKYRKRIEELTQELNNRYDLTDDQVCIELRTKLIEEELKEKRRFFGLEETKTEKSRAFTKERAPIVREIDEDDAEFIHIDHEPSEEEKKEWEAKGRKVVALDMTEPMEALKKLEAELMEKYSEKDNLMLKRDEIVADIIKQEAPKIRRTVEMERKLFYYKEDLHSKFPDKASIDKALNAYEKDLIEFYVPHGVDVMENDKQSVSVARQVYSDYEQKKKDDDMWEHYKDDEKVEYFKIRHENFYNANPIVVKFMIIENMWSEAAFKKFLLKCRTNAPSKTNPYSMDARPSKIKNNTKLTDSEEKWIENQAYYVEYLHDELEFEKTNRRLTQHRRKTIRTNAYAALRKEMSSFKTNTQKRSDELIKKSNKANIQLIKEFANDVKNGKHTLSLESINKLVEYMETLAKLEAIAKEENERTIANMSTEFKAEDSDISTPELV